MAAGTRSVVAMFDDSVKLENDAKRRRREQQERRRGCGEGLSSDIRILRRKYSKR